ncbi:MAG: YbaN family protein [Piscirickettsiaceae bacterium]|nr:YbaN family protein [Piscirickettsiaceae bacterium]
MQTKIKHYCLIALGWFFIILAVIGALLPLLPTTPFLIIALACFAESSPRFHRMLLKNKWFGPPLAQWERSKTIRRKIKHRVMILIIATFSISIFILSGRANLQIMLVCFCLILLSFVWRLKESNQ